MLTIEQNREGIQVAIRQCGQSQSSISKQIVVGQQVISEYLHGKSMPALDTFANLCKVLDLDANEILCIK